MQVGLVIAVDYADDAAESPDQWPNEFQRFVEEVGNMGMHNMPWQKTTMQKQYSPDINRRFELALSTMGQLYNVWRNKHLKLSKKLHVNDMCDASIQKHGRFLMKLARRFRPSTRGAILGVKWQTLTNINIIVIIIINKHFYVQQCQSTK